MRVAKIDKFDLLNNPGDNGPALTIWLAGCPFNCKGCHNPELQDYGNGKERSIMDVAQEIAEVPHQSVVLLGGEPLAQHDIFQLVGVLHGMGKKVWLYTGYDLGSIPKGILDRVYFVKTGQYMELLATNSFPASSNQQVYRRKNGKLVREV